MYSERFEPRVNSSRALLRELYDWAEIGMMAVVMSVLLFTFVVRTIGVDGESMMPTLEHEDRLVVTRMFYTPKQGDIVVVTKPNHRNESIIKRVIAVPGQTVDIDFAEGVVYVDGQALVEDYIDEPTYARYDLPFPQVVPEGHVFILGDNRNNSWDSRAEEIGMVDNRYIMGRVVFRLLPFGSIGVLE